MNVWLHLLLMCATVYAIRVLPFLILRQEIKSRFIRSFLYYVPYVTLAAMTFPAMMDATASPVGGAIAFVFAIILAWRGASLFAVSVMACLMVFIVELIPFIN